MAEEFLPADYKVPQKGGNYMKFQEGRNTFRILSRPIVGYETWVDNKPKRYRVDEEYPKDAKHFWAVPVYNYDEEAIQILSITQKTVMTGIIGLSEDPDWGSPLGYDIVVTRSGKTLNDTEYAVQPKPARPLDSGIKQAFADMRIDLEKYFSGEDPFETVTPEGEEIADKAFKDIG